MARLVTIERADPAPGIDYREMRGLGDGEDADLLVLSPDEMVAAIERLRRNREEVSNRGDGARARVGA
jgi:hypothetical protein